MNVCVILPTYNEKENIVRLLDLLHHALEPVTSRHTLRYIVADDTSPDKTAEVVRVYQKKHSDVYLLSGKKEGLGRALMRGAAYAIKMHKADIIIQMDADLSHDPESLPEFIAAIEKGADFAIGCRYIPGGSIPKNWGVHRKIFSIMGNAIVRYGLGHPKIHDWTGGYRAYRKEYFEAIQSKVQNYSGYVFQIAFLYEAVLIGARIVEIPIHFRDRMLGRSKIAFTEYIPNILRYVARQRYLSVRHGPFGKFLVVGTIGFIINTIGLEGLVAAGFVPWVAGAIGAELAIISNFILNNSWTFSHKKISGNRLVGKFIQFNLTSAGAIVIQAATIALGSRLWGVSLYRLYYIFGVGLGLIWNYTMYSLVIWRK